MEQIDKILFSDLHWHRLSITLLNIRTSSQMAAHPLSIINAIIKGVSISVSGKEELSVIFRIKDKRHTYKMRSSDKLAVEVLFFVKEKEYISSWTAAFKSYLSHPVTGKNFELIEMSGVEERSFAKLIEEHTSFKPEGEICLDFLTPYPFQRQKDKHRIFISKETFIKSFEKRFSRLFKKEVIYRSLDDNFSILPYYWKYTEIKHQSKSQPGNTQYLNGCFGKLYIKGLFKDFLPFLLLGSELHTGIKTSNSLGYYTLYNDPPGYFETYFPDKKVILSCLREVIERYDNALQSLSEDSFPFNEDEYTEKIFKQITDNSYIPSPNIAFLIKKKSGTERLVEQVRFNDLVIQQYILKTITNIFDRMLEDVSIGFRKGLSRGKAVEMVQDAVKQGYLYVIESDIEDFFPSVDISILVKLLDFYIPKKDAVLKNLLIKFLKNGYLLNNSFHERVKGLAQGSPLSPLLANLYLDSFDEEIIKAGVKMVRYADDFIILTKSKEEAEEILSLTKAHLLKVGLHINKDKTAIKEISEGFRFLGMDFGKSESSGINAFQEEPKLFKKPLYITEPFLFLSLNGEAIDIKSDRKIIETIPLRRVSEIMVMEKTTFSTAMITRCTELNIPFTITLNTGYYITTIKPDSKKYYDLTFQHSKKYYSLNDTEFLCIAKEFVAGKLNNYISLFKQKYRAGDNHFIKELEMAVKRIYEAGDINTIRGLEGAMAKKVYQYLNSFIEDNIFHIKKRDRKTPDRINSMLNFGYYLLFSRINATVRATGLNPYLGFLHSPEDNYESFVCDIQELFRSRIDRLIIRMINLKVITKDDFVETEKGIYLKSGAVKKFINQFEAEMEKKVSNHSLSLKENIYVQVTVIKKWFTENGQLSFYNWQDEGKKAFTVNRMDFKFPS